jgi:hypothetical protein
MFQKSTLTSSIASALMEMYQSMGDALAHQYGGSAAHNKVCTFSLLWMYVESTMKATKKRQEPTMIIFRKQ